MMHIKELLDKIKWDDREKPEEYSLLYLDFGNLKEIKYTEIKKIEEGFMTVKVGDIDTQIPLHRIKVVMKKGKIIWQRPMKD